MDFSFTPSQSSIRAEMSAFATAHLADVTPLSNREQWLRCAKQGVIGLPLPAEFSGSDQADVLTTVMAMEGLGYGCPDNGLPFALNAHIWTVQAPILKYGSDNQRAKYLRAFSEGRLIGAHAMSEPDCGSDAFSMSTLATPVDGGYVLNGQKVMISLAPIADVFLVFATSDIKAGRWAISAFLVDRATPGLTVSEPTKKMGLDTVPMGNLTFTDCFILQEQLLSREGSGVALASDSLEFERCCILASQLGRMHRQLDDTIERAKSRKQFGQPIGSFQSVSNRIADMKVRLEAARLLLYKAGWKKSQGESIMMEAATLKLFLSEQFLASGIDALRIHGGGGYMTGSPIEADVRDALGGVLYAGTSDVQRNIISRLLGVG